LLPLIRRQFNPKADGALFQLAIQAREAQHVIEARAADVMNDCVAVEYTSDRSPQIGRRIEIDCARLVTEPPVVVREVVKAAWTAANWPLQSMGYTEWQLLANMVGKNCQQTVGNLPSNIQVRREGDLLCLAPLGFT
jgi:hypothetical protein